MSRSLSYSPAFKPETVMNAILERQILLVTFSCYNFNTLVTTIGISTASNGRLLATRLMFTDMTTCSLLFTILYL